jgi:hypothetical protein
MLVCAYDLIKHLNKCRSDEKYTGWNCASRLSATASPVSDSDIGSPPGTCNGDKEVETYILVFVSSLTATGLQDPRIELITATIFLSFVQPLRHRRLEAIGREFYCLLDRSFRRISSWMLSCWGVRGFSWGRRLREDECVTFWMDLVSFSTNLSIASLLFTTQFPRGLSSRQA